MRKNSILRGAWVGALLVSIVFLAPQEGDPGPTKFEVVGEYVWACSCDIVCPCIFGSPNTTDNCRFPMVYHIDHGQYGEIDLSGLNLVWMSLDGPKPLIRTFMQGKAVAAIFVDDRASAAQRQALLDVFQRVRGRFYRKIHPARVAPIHYTVDGGKRRVTIPGRLDLELDLVRNNGRPVEIINAPYWTSRVRVGRAIKHTYTDKDLGYEWDFSGKYGDYAGFHWTDQTDLYKGLLEKWKKEHPEETSRSDSANSSPPPSSERRGEDSRSAIYGREGR